MRAFIFFTFLVFSLFANAQTTPQPDTIPLPLGDEPQATESDPVVAPTENNADHPSQPPAAADASSDKKESWSWMPDPKEFSIVNVGRGLSRHKPMYVFPFSYSDDYHGNDTEMIYQISVKQRLLNRNFYLGYTQKSFWQVYDRDDSRPFRETNYNPEFFYRWTPETGPLHGWGFDFGAEHNSNGQATEFSRSWNRAYIGAFLARGKNLLYVKGWYRLPEDEKAFPEDPTGDDNPDINQFYGYSEIHYARQLGGQHAVSGMVRGNPKTGNGAFSLTYSFPMPGRNAFYGINFWHGYGESLIDYNRSITRISVGFMLAR